MILGTEFSNFTYGNHFAKFLLNENFIRRSDSKPFTANRRFFLFFILSVLGRKLLKKQTKSVARVLISRKMSQRKDRALECIFLSLQYRIVSFVDWCVLTRIAS